MTPTDTYKFLQRDKTRKVCRTIVFEWHDRFFKGRTDLGDNIRSGRPSYSDADVASVRKELETDRQKSIEEISSRTGLKHGTTHKILSADLGMHKVCARWVPETGRTGNVTWISTPLGDWRHFFPAPYSNYGWDVAKLLWSRNKTSVYDLEDRWFPYT